MDILSQYTQKVRKALEAVSCGCDPAKELALLKPYESKLQDYITSITRRPDPIKAAEQHSANASAMRAVQPFLLTFNGGGVEHITGWSALAKRTKLQESSIRVLLSKGKGKFYLNRFNPTTGERDILTVARTLLPGQPEKPKMGRPRTRPLTEAEATADLHGTVKPTSNRKPR